MEMMLYPAWDREIISDGIGLPSAISKVSFLLTVIVVFCFVKGITVLFRYLIKDIQQQLQESRRDIVQHHKVGLDLLSSAEFVGTESSSILPA